MLLFIFTTCSMCIRYWPWCPWSIRDLWDWLFMHKHRLLCGSGFDWTSNILLCSPGFVYLWHDCGHWKTPFQEVFDWLLLGLSRKALPFWSGQTGVSLTFHLSLHQIWKAFWLPIYIKLPIQYLGIIPENSHNCIFYLKKCSLESNS